MDIEWAKDGRTGELFIVQARPETVQRAGGRGGSKSTGSCARGPVLVDGPERRREDRAGPVRVIKKRARPRPVPPGEVLVTDKTDPDWEPIMKKAAAIVTNRGGRTCHAAIVSRELGVPAIVGTEHGTDALGRQVVTVSCAEGDRGVYDGGCRFDVERSISAICRGPDEDHDERRQPGRGVLAVVPRPTTASAWRAWSSSSATHRRPPDGAADPTSSEAGRREGTIAPHRRLHRQARSSSTSWPKASRRSPPPSTPRT